jgi:hypothetical protein
MSLEDQTLSNAQLDSLIEQLQDEDITVRGKAVLALGRIADVKALKPLKEINTRQGIYRIDSEVENAQRQIVDRALVGDFNLLCRQCFCRFKSFTEVLEIFDLVQSFTYYACRCCHRDTCLLIAVEEVILVMDRSLEALYAHEGDTVMVNWFNMKKPADITGIQIKTATDYDVEEMVMILKNDMDKKRRKRLPSVQVTVEPDAAISKAKLNLLKDSFQLKA